MYVIKQITICAEYRDMLPQASAGFVRYTWASAYRPQPRFLTNQPWPGQHVPVFCTDLNLYNIYTTYWKLSLFDIGLFRWKHILWPNNFAKSATGHYRDTEPHTPWYFRWVVIRDETLSIVLKYALFYLCVIMLISQMFTKNQGFL